MGEYNKLVEYEIEQQLKVTNLSDEIVRKGFVTSAQDLYPDVDLPSHCSYIRGSIPVKMMLLLYDKVVVYFPPSTVNHLVERSQTSYKDLICLCKYSLIQPLIGHPTDYIEPHFNELLACNPPSVWARGVSLLSKLSMGDTLEIAKSKLPLERISKLPKIEAHWKAYFPFATKKQLQENIIRELSTLYADLCIFGYSHIANSLSQFKQLGEVAFYLRFLNEILTYPILFGMGATPNYNTSTSIISYRKNCIKLPLNTTSKIELIPPELEILLKGYGIYADDLSIEDLMKFRSSNGGEHLRKAMREFDESAENILSARRHKVDDLFQKASILQEILKESIAKIESESRMINKAERKYKYLLAIGGVAIGGLLGKYLGGDPISIVGLILGGNAELLLHDFIKNPIIAQDISSRLSPRVAHLWKAQQAMKRVRR